MTAVAVMFAVAAVPMLVVAMIMLVATVATMAALVAMPVAASEGVGKNVQENIAKKATASKAEKHRLRQVAGKWQHEQRSYRDEDCGENSADHWVWIEGHADAGATAGEDAGSGGACTPIVAQRMEEALIQHGRHVMGIMSTTRKEVSKVYQVHTVHVLNM